MLQICYIPPRGPVANYYYYCYYCYYPRLLLLLLLLSHPGNNDPGTPKCCACGRAHRSVSDRGRAATVRTQRNRANRHARKGERTAHQAKRGTPGGPTLSPVRPPLARSRARWYGGMHAYWSRLGRSIHGPSVHQVKRAYYTGPHHRAVSALRPALERSLNLPEKGSGLTFSFRSAFFS